MTNRLQLTKLIAVIGLTALLGACASPARMNAMIPERTAETTISENSPLLSSIELGAVSGGESTNPLWTSEVGNPEFQAALRNALANHALLAKINPKYELTAHLLNVDQPVIGTSFTVTSSVRYEIIDKKSRKHIINETIQTPYTASFSDAFIAVERLRLANEGAIRENIAALIKLVVAESEKFAELMHNQSPDLTELQTNRPAS